MEVLRRHGNHAATVNVCAARSSLEHMPVVTSVNGRIVVTFAGPKRLLIKVELMPGSEWLILPLAPGRAT
jgi:hypothetical protein